jgi:hypothetical protein
VVRENQWAPKPRGKSAGSLAKQKGMMGMEEIEA